MQQMSKFVEKENEYRLEQFMEKVDCCNQKKEA